MINPQIQRLQCRRRQYNQILCMAILILLLIWLASIWPAWQDYRQKQRWLGSKQLQLERYLEGQSSDSPASDVTTFQKTSLGWMMLDPKEVKASQRLIEVLLGSLASQCQLNLDDVNDLPETKGTTSNARYFAKLQLLDQRETFWIGERITGSEQIEVMHHDTRWRCDKILASVALSPLLGFVDKSLYRGELVAIKSEFDEITDPETLVKLNLDVPEVVSVNLEKSRGSVIGRLSFVSRVATENTPQIVSYAVLINDATHLLFIDEKTALGYLINSAPAFNQLLGLE